MNEPMREVTRGLDVTGIDQAYPGVRKVTVDAANRTAYVFGRGNRATVVTGAEFEALAAMLPPPVEPMADEPVEPMADEPVEVEPVEAGISVVKEPEAKRPSRGQKKES